MGEKKEFKFGKDDPIIYTYPDQKELSKALQDNLHLSGEDRLWIYELYETNRIIREKERIITNIRKVRWFLIFIPLFIVILIMDNPRSSLIISNILFAISIFFSAYLFSKKINIYDKQRELDKYIIILKINKNVKDITDLMQYIKEEVMKKKDEKIL